MQKNERTGLLLAGLGMILLAIYITYSPTSHHYMMMGQYYLGLLPSLSGIAGIMLLFAGAYLILVKGERAKMVADLEEGLQEPPAVENTETNPVEDRLKLASKLLNDDEALVLGIIADNEGITQDSLRARTEFSHSKISMIIKKLEEKDLIYRERFGKTFKLYLSDWVKN
ncbi:helix-turn-helix transcriptional regulator [Archaeoglobus neptunius]|uniref:helix-turn-helix transcriptional regulator n=1 Tax=Archaeoglobus neptunius TaxID=2798580 RepID=UPI00192857DE|nr:MarR family transcriptional regulator [Archaeoglobus neptunius]